MRGSDGTQDSPAVETLQNGHPQAPGSSEILDGARVTLRKYDTETDEAFIYSSWRNGLYYHTEPKDKGDSARFFREATQRIRRILKGASVSIACLEDSPIVIVGYVVLTGTHLEWIYVKEDFRNKGIGRLLWGKKHGIETVTDRFTKIGRVLIDKFRLKTFQEESGD